MFEKIPVKFHKHREHLNWAQKILIKKKLKKNQTKKEDYWIWYKYIQKQYKGRYKCRAFRPFKTPKHPLFHPFSHHPPPFPHSRAKEAPIPTVISMEPPTFLAFFLHLCLFCAFFWKKSSAVFAHFFLETKIDVLAHMQILTNSIVEYFFEIIFKKDTN